MENRTRLVALTGALGALTLALSAAEGAFMIYLPFLPVGVRPGFSNIVITLGAVAAGPAGAYALAAVKIIFALLTRGASAAVMSAAGTLLSVTAAVIMLRGRGRIFSFIGISAAGACLHLTGQTLAAAVLTGAPALLSTLKIALPFGLVTGVMTGLIMELTFPLIIKTKPFKDIASRR